MGGANLRNASKGLKRQESWGFLKAQNAPHGRWRDCAWDLKRLHGR